MTQFPVMNETKWDELRLAMYELGDLSPRWRTKDRESGYLSNWDGEWFYHFRTGGYSTIEWLEVAAASAKQRAAVLDVLRKIHVPGEEVSGGFRVYGYVPSGTSVEYL